MTIAPGAPFRLIPWRKTFLRSASVWLPMPVSLSCVMLGAVTLNGGSSHERPPEYALSRISTCGPFGGWQLPQVRIPLTRYSPRLTRSELADWALAVPVNTAPNANTKSPVRNVMKFPHEAMPPPTLHHTGSVRTRKRKGRHRMPPFRNHIKILCGRGRGLFGLLLLHRPGVLPLGLDVAIDEFNDCL